MLKEFMDKWGWRIYGPLLVAAVGWFVYGLWFKG